MTIDQWHRCYADGWRGIISDESFAHPAKMAKNLANRIYDHAFERGWVNDGDCVLDPFGGIGGTAYGAILHDLRWLGVELEPKFVSMAEKNIERWVATGRECGFPNGNARIVRGDSRRLIEVLRDAGALPALVVSSPPYVSGDHHADQTGAWGGNAQALTKDQAGYGAESGQLGKMKEGEAPALVVSSPPYAGSAIEKNSASVDLSKQYETYRAQGGGASFEKFCATQEKHSGHYGTEAGQIGRMREGDAPALLVSSPPYAGIATGAGGLNTKPGTDGQQSGRSASAPSQATDQRYGSSDGQLAVMAEGDVAAIVSSPPFEKSLSDAPSDAIRSGVGASFGASSLGDGYGQTDGQIGAESGETFWQSAAEIVAQCYAILKPGGVAIWVTKDFVRKGKRVPFGDQWQALCESRGFVLECRHHAMLVEHHGEQDDLFGETKVLKTEHKSFFRRLHESKEGAVRIDWEDVICVRKPL